LPYPALYGTFWQDSKPTERFYTDIGLHLCSLCIMKFYFAGTET